MPISSQQVVWSLIIVLALLRHNVDGLVGPGRSFLVKRCLAARPTVAEFDDSLEDSMISNPVQIDMGESSLLPLEDPHPMDDPPMEMPEVEPPKKKFNRNVPPANFFILNIPTDPKEEWEWFLEQYRLILAGEIADRAMLSQLKPIVRHWMMIQRKRYLRTLGKLSLRKAENHKCPRLTRREKERLDALGFDWGHVKAPDDFVFSDEVQNHVTMRERDYIWRPLCRQLIKYKEAHGDTRVVYDDTNKELFVWATTQRQARWQMQERRRNWLDKIEFDWDYAAPPVEEPQQPPKPKAKKLRFETRVSQLKKFRVEYGHCNVPYDYEESPGLAEWIDDMKSRWLDLSPSSVRRLEVIGINFEVDQNGNN